MGPIRLNLFPLLTHIWMQYVFSGWSVISDTIFLTLKTGISTLTPKLMFTEGIVKMGILKKVVRLKETYYLHNFVNPYEPI